MHAIDRFLFCGFGRCLCHKLDLLSSCGGGYGLRNYVSYSLSLWERVVPRNPQSCSSVFESQALITASSFLKARSGWPGQGINIHAIAPQTNKTIPPSTVPRIICLLTKSFLLLLCLRIGEMRRQGQSDHGNQTATSCVPGPG